MSPSLPYTVVQTRDRGKCVIAARDIEAGELVLEDRPLLVTPLIKSKPQCLQCARSVAQLKMRMRCGGGSRCKFCAVKVIPLKHTTPYVPACLL